MNRWSQRPPPKHKTAVQITGMPYKSFTIGTLMAALSKAWRDKVSAEAGRTGADVPWEGERVSLICSFNLKVGAGESVKANLSLT